MGHIARMTPGLWAREYGLDTFVETGVFEGKSLGDMLKVPEFRRLISLEISPKQIAVATAHLNCVGESGDHNRWEIILGDSAELVHQLCAGEDLEDARVLWWLDAHFPEMYSEETATRLPLLDEVEAIVTCKRDHSRDVIAMDDWRVYE
ncbi:hypothetical protein LCGC14_2716780, partial [marine sediment metagenome]